MAIGEKLERLLEERHTNVRQLALATNISPSTIYSIITRNSTKIDLNVLQTIADALYVTLEYFTDRRIEKASEFTLSEQEYIKKYRSLDDYGKNTVNMVLENELFRVWKQSSIAQTNTVSSNPEVQAASESNKEIPDLANVNL